MAARDGARRRQHADGGVQHRHRHAGPASEHRPQHHAGAPPDLRAPGRARTRWEIPSGARRVVGGGGRPDVEVQAAPRRQVSQRRGLHRRRRQVHPRPARRHQGPDAIRPGLSAEHRRGGGPGPPHDPDQDQGPVSRPARSAPPERRDHPAGLFPVGGQGALRPRAEWHRPLSLRLVAAGRPGDAPGERPVLGRQAGLRRVRVSADPGGDGAGGGARQRRDRPRRRHPRRAREGARVGKEHARGDPGGPADLHRARHDQGGAASRPARASGAESRRRRGGDRARRARRPGNPPQRAIFPRHDRATTRRSSPTPTTRTAPSVSSPRRATREAST